jgi:hypothetical protein
MDDLDKLAAEIFDYACANRRDNLNKDGTAGDPRAISCKFEDLYDGPKEFYRSIARWHLNKVALDV